MGMFISIALSYKRGLLWGFIIWAFVIIGIPEIRQLIVSKSGIESEKNINLKKMTKLWARERQDLEKVLPLLKDKKKNIDKIKKIWKKRAESYIENEGTDNKILEQELQQSVKVQSDRMEDFSCFLPWSFYPQAQESLSSKGYKAYNGFVNFAIEQRDGFFRYIIDKRYNANDPKVIPYFKKGENVFHSKSTWPRKSWIGVLSTVAFSLLFIGLSFMVYRRQRIKDSRGKVKEMNVWLFNQRQCFFLNCKDREKVAQLTRFFQTREDMAIIEKVDLHTYDPGTCLKHWLEYIVAGEGFDKNELMEMLAGLGVSKEELKLSPWKINDELFRKVYLALKMCERKKINILLDFFRGDTEEFEILCKEMMKKRPFRFVYLSDRPLNEIEMEEIQLPSTTFLVVNWLHRDYIVR
jgi:hypothetical protein